MEIFGAAAEAVFSFLVVGALLGGIGHGIQTKIVGPASHGGWRELWHRTAWAHPIAAGALLGLSEQLPMPEAMGEGIVPRMIWYALAGVFSVYIYRRLQRRMRTAADDQSHQ